MTEFQSLNLRRKECQMQKKILNLILKCILNMIDSIAGNHWESGEIRRIFNFHFITRFEERSKFAEYLKIPQKIPQKICLTEAACLQSLPRMLTAQLHSNGTNWTAIEMEAASSFVCKTAAVVANRKCLAHRFSCIKVEPKILKSKSPNIRNL